MEEAPKQISSNKLVLKLCKYLLLLATLVATVTYAAGFNPPGGVWQDPPAGSLAGEPILRDTHYRRYLIFFYSNAAAFASSVVVIVLMLLLDLVHKGKYCELIVKPLRLVFLLDLLSLMMAYAAGTCRDMFTTLCYLLLLLVFFVFLGVQVYRNWTLDEDKEEKGTRLRKHKVLMLLATFAVSVTYVAGLGRS